MQTRPLPMVAIVLALSAFLSLLAVLLLSPTGAPATFRGKNGRIAYAAHPGIFTMKPNGTDSRPLITARPHSVGNPDFSPNGKKVVFIGPDSSKFYHLQIFIARFDGSDRQPLTHVSEQTDLDNPEFSPNGKRIAFTACSRECVVYIMRADGSAKSPVTRGVHPTWFPGGGRIAFTRFSGHYPFNKWAIFTIRTNGRQLRRLTHDKRSHLLDISPNGRKILFRKEKDRLNRLYVMRPNGSHRHSLKWRSRRWLPVEASFSPNGTRIAVGLLSGFKSKIYVMRANGAHQHRLTPRVPVDAPSMDWGPRR